MLRSFPPLLLAVACSTAPEPVEPAAVSAPPVPGDVLQALPWRGSVLQRTSEGLVLQRHAHDGSLSAMLHATPPATVIGLAADGRPLAGLDTGCIQSLDSEPAQPHDCHPGNPTWIGALGTDTWVIRVLPGSDTSEPGLPISLQVLGHTPSSVDHQALGPLWPSWMTPTAFAVDAQRRLWLGWANGEWGGVVAWADCSVDPCTLRDVSHLTLTEVHGFVSRGTELLAYGGFGHMFEAGGVHRLGPEGAETLYARDMYERGLAPDDGEPPCTPVRHLLPRSGGWWVQSGSQIWQTDERFERWQLVRALDWHIPSAWEEPDGDLVLALMGGGTLVLTEEKPSPGQ